MAHKIHWILGGNCRVPLWHSQHSRQSETLTSLEVKIKVVLVVRRVLLHCQLYTTERLPIWRVMLPVQLLITFIQHVKSLEYKWNVMSWKSCGAQLLWVNHQAPDLIVWSLYILKNNNILTNDINPKTCWYVSLVSYQSISSLID